MPALTKTGWFLCEVKSWGIREAKETQSVSVTLKLETRAEWDGTQWVEAMPLDVFGDFYFIGKDGQVLRPALENLTKANLWRGEGLMLYDNDPEPGLHVVVQVGTNIYNGKTTYRAEWVYHVDHKPGAGGIANRASRERLMELEAKTGAMIRAALPTPF